MVQNSSPPLTVADVSITEELDRRAPPQTDYLREKLALQDLAVRMAERPEEVFPRLVDLALEITGSASAGLSLYEESSAPAVFRWSHLRGELAPFEGVTTPRGFSPGGVALDHGGPVLLRHPERVYDWIANAKIILPEMLLVPLYLGDKVPVGALWVVSDREGHFDSGHARVLRELAAFVGIALRMLRNEHPRHRRGGRHHRGRLAPPMPPTPPAPPGAACTTDATDASDTTGGGLHHPIPPTPPAPPGRPAPPDATDPSGTTCTTDASGTTRDRLRYRGGSEAAPRCREPTLGTVRVVRPVRWARGRSSQAGCPQRLP